MLRAYYLDTGHRADTRALTADMRSGMRGGRDHGGAAMMMRNPAEELLGKQLGDWSVTRRILPGPNSTGSTFSVGYIVEHTESKRDGFLKALDILGAMRRTSMDLRALLNAHAYEQNLLERCVGAKHIAVAIDHGEYRDPSRPELPVPYLVFDLAIGDIRSERLAKAFDAALKLRCLHNIASGIQQLHARKISHQDIKPSNVLVFRDNVARLGDLGRAIDGLNGSMFDQSAFAGDKNHAPPEVLYRAPHSGSWEDLRFTADLYQLGSLVVYVFTDLYANTMLLDHLAPHHYPFAWGDSYDALHPFLEAAFYRSLDTLEAALSRHFESRGPITRLRRVVEYLCHPTPTQRGHPANHRGNRDRYGLERFVSEFDLLATAAEHKLLSHLKP